MSDPAAVLTAAADHLRAAPATTYDRALADLLGHAAADVRQCERANAHSPGAPLLQPMTEAAVTLARAVLGAGR